MIDAPTVRIILSVEQRRAASESLSVYKKSHEHNQNDTLLPSSHGGATEHTTTAHSHVSTCINILCLDVLCAGKLPGA